MAEFIAKLGLDAKDFITSMETAAAKAASITTALNSSAGSSKTLADGFKSANTEATNLDKNVKSIEGNLSKAASGGGALDGLTAKFKEGQTAASQGGGIFGDLAGKLGNLASPAGAATAAIGGITAALAGAISIGQEFQQNLAGVSAVTGLTGPGLDDIGSRARDLAKQFGGDASTQLQAFQGVLSKFGASLADTPEQLGKVSENINILAKAGGLDAKEAMDTLANSMLQFGVDVADGNVAAAESARFMNVLAASAKVGAAEIPQVGQAVLVAGVAAKSANVSFEETNAAIQVLAAGGKVGAEAGTALRNVLGKLAGEDVLPKEALEKLKSLGVNMDVVSNTSIPLSARLKELGKASSDATAFAQVFGTENAAAATILATGAGTIEEWTKQITGTNEANVQAATNMNTLSEQLSRARAAFADIGLAIFNVVSPAFSFIIKGIFDLVGLVTGALSSAISSIATPIQNLVNNLGGWGKILQTISPLLITVAAAIAGYQLVVNAATIADYAQTAATQVKTAAMTAYTAIQTALSSGLGITTAAQYALNLAMNLNPVGILVAAIAALVAGLVLAYQNFDGFRAVVDKVWNTMRDGVIKGFEILTKGIQDAWNWFKQIAVTVGELYLKFNPLAIAFRAAYDNIEFFRKGVDAAIGFVQELIKYVKEAVGFVGSLFSSTNQTAEVKVKTKIEAAPDDSKKLIEELKKAAETALGNSKNFDEKQADQQRKALNNKLKALKDAGKIETAEAQAIQKVIDSIKAGKTGDEKVKDISDQIRAQQAAIDTIKREAEESSVRDENARAIRNLENQYKDRIAKVKDGNLKIQAEDKVSAAQKAQFAALSNDQILALEQDLASKLAALRQKQQEKAAEDAKKAFDRFEAEAKKRSDAARKEEEELQKLRDEAIDEAEEARQALAARRRQREAEEDKKAEEKRQKIVQAFTDAIDKIRKDSSERAVKQAQNRDALDAEEKSLNDSLNSRKLSYEEFNVKIAELERRRAELQADVQSGANSTFKNEMGALVAGIRASIGQSLTNMREDFDFEFSEARKKGELNLQALGGSAATLFGSLVANGSSAVDALKQSLSQTLGALIEVYVAPIIASTLSFLGPFALPVALAAVQGLKSLLNSALAGFQDGGYTGDRGEGAVAGVVHGQEFVHTASVTRKNRALFEYLHKGGELSNWAVSAAGNLQQPVSIAAPMMNTYGIESRLDRLETAIVKSSKRFDSMRAVQMTVEHDPTLTIKAQSRNLQVRNARV
jgi:TP901 family phage tail tape measure protein